MESSKHFRKAAWVVSLVLLCSAHTSAQLRPRNRPEPVVNPDAQSTPSARSESGIQTRVDGLKYTAFYNDPCAIVTRDELEAILKRNDTDRALVRVGRAAWHNNMTRVGCGYGVNYEKRIFPEEPFDNSVTVWIDFDDKFAKQGKLVIDVQRDPFHLRRYADSDFDLEIVKGLGDEALYARDKSRFKYEEKYAGTAGATPHQYYDNGDFLYVRLKETLLGFKVTRIVAGGSHPDVVIQIARKALERVPTLQD